MSVQKPPRYYRLDQGSPEAQGYSSDPTSDNTTPLSTIRSLPHLTLPKEVINRIIAHVEDDSALSKCMRVSRATREMVKPLLYNNFEITYDCEAGQHFEHEALLASLGSRRSSSLSPIARIGTISLNPVALCECITYMVTNRFSDRDRPSLPRLKAFIITDAGETGKDEADMKGYISAYVPFLTDKVVFQDSFDLGFGFIQRDSRYRADLSPIPQHIISSIQELVFLHTAWIYEKPNLFYQTRDVRDSLDDLTSIKLILRPSMFYPGFKPSDYPKYVSDTLKQLVEVLKTTDKVFKPSLRVHKVVLVGIAEAFEPNCASPYSRFASEDDRKVSVVHHDYEQTKKRLHDMVREVNEGREKAKPTGKDPIKVEIEIKTFEEYLMTDEYKTEVPEYLVPVMRSYARRWKRTVETPRADGLDDIGAGKGAKDRDDVGKVPAIKRGEDEVIQRFRPKREEGLSVQVKGGVDNTDTDKGGPEPVDGGETKAEGSSKTSKGRQAGDKPAGGKAPSTKAVAKVGGGSKAQAKGKGKARGGRK